MAGFEMIPCLVDPMSCYTLAGFMLLIGILTCASKLGLKRMDRQERDMRKTDKCMATMETDIAVMKETLKGIQLDGQETRTAIAEINRTLIDKLT